MINNILRKILIVLFGTTRRFLRTFLLAAILLLFGLLMIIKIFWKPVEYIMIFILLLILSGVIYKIRKGRTLNAKFDEIEYLLLNENYNKAFEKNEKIKREDIQNINEYEKRDAEYRYYYYKAECLYKKSYAESIIEDFKESIKYYEKVAQLAPECKKNEYSRVMVRLGNLYTSLGIIQNDEKLLETALEILSKRLENINLKEDFDEKKLNIALIHKQIGQVYVELAEHKNREEYLKKALLEYDAAYDELRKQKTKYDFYYILLNIASALRKLNEINFDEERKSKAIRYLNDYSEFLETESKKFNVRTAPNFYFAYQNNYAWIYFELAKINNSNEYIEKFNECGIRMKNCSDKRAYAMKFFDKMSKELGINN